MLIASPSSTKILAGDGFLVIGLAIEEMRSAQHLRRNIGRK
jgi:hypothetical protein